MAQEQQGAVVVEPETGQVVPANLAMVKMEWEQMSRIAAERHRDPREVLKMAMAEVAIAPELATKQWYRLPFKTKEDCPCDGTIKGHSRGKHKKEKVTEGLAIGAAYTLAGCYGFCSQSASVVAETERGWLIEGTFVDFQNMRIVKRPVQVLKFYKPHGTTRIVYWPEDRWPQLQGAGFSKAIRNATIGALPLWLTMAFWKEARRIAGLQEAQRAGGSKPPSKSEEAKAQAVGETAQPKLTDPRKAAEHVLKALAPYKVSQEAIERKLGHPLAQIEFGDLAEVKGWLNLLEAGERTVGEVFDLDQPPAEEETVAGDDSPLGADVVDVPDGE